MRPAVPVAHSATPVAVVLLGRVTHRRRTHRDRTGARWGLCHGFPPSAV